MRALSILCGFARSIQSNRSNLISSVAGVLNPLRCRALSTMSREDPELKELLDFMDNLKNYEKSGVPKGAGTDSDDGFDLGRMRRLMALLGNPHSTFKVCLFYAFLLFHILHVFLCGVVNLLLY